MSKFVILFVCLALFHFGSALNCYSCNREKCDNEGYKNQQTPCGKNAGNAVGACLKHVFKDRVTGKEMSNRKCILSDKDASGKLTYKCNINEGDEISCNLCQTDLCNSAPGIHYTYFTFMGVFLAYVIPKFLVQ